MSTLNRNILWVLGISLLLLVVYYFADIVTYVLVAWALSMLGRPLCSFFQKYGAIGRIRIGPSTAALLTIITFYAALAGMLLLFVPTIVAQARNLSTVDYQGLGEKLQPILFNFDVQLHQIGLLSPGESLATHTQQALTNWFKPTLVGDFLGGFLGAAGNVAVTFASITFILFFFLQDSNLFSEIIHAVTPDRQEKKVQSAIQESNEILNRYIRGLLLQGLVFSFLTALLLWIFGINNALLIGSFGGLFNIVPYIGPIMGMVFGEFIVLSSNLDLDFALLWPKLLKVALAFMIVQAIDNNLVGPLIMSKSVQAHPLEIFIVTLAAAKMGGVLGMVVGIPVYTVMRVVARNFFSQFKVVQRLTDHMDED